MRLATFTLLAFAAAAPATGQPRGASCDISAYIAGRDAVRLNVRATPSTAGPVLRALGNAGSGVARITGQRGDWFRISSIIDAETDRALFRGDGWVHMSLLGTSVANADPRLYARPVRQSRSFARLVADESQVTLVGCSGRWAQVRFRRLTGWLSPDGQCSNPLTTCA